MHDLFLALLKDIGMWIFNRFIFFFRSFFAWLPIGKVSYYEPIAMKSSRYQPSHYDRVFSIWLFATLYSIFILLKAERNVVFEAVAAFII